MQQITIAAWRYKHSNQKYTQIDLISKSVAKTLQ